MNKDLAEKLWILTLIFVGLFSSGCTTPPPIPMELRYSEPTSEPNTSTLQGSEQPVKLIFDDFTVYILDIDGKRVMAGRQGWQTPIRISEGRHMITAEFVHGAFNCTAEIEFEAKSGQKYQVLFKSNLSVNPHACDFWIIDQNTQKSASTVVRSLIGGGGQGAYVPIFIPVR